MARSRAGSAGDCLGNGELRQIRNCQSSRRVGPNQLVSGDQVAEVGSKQGRGKTVLSKCCALTEDSCTEENNISGQGDLRENLLPKCSINKFGHWEYSTGVGQQSRN
ncbi:hypothetical protein AV530_007812 [Patagioenas fasciata monilis]|uniref:Uncharacterized protein n=1 Tax=Patagioenas fasciata monilis TaxID=372326 RepID=A0A1V4JSX5_PATFA|nr:hypothetical protein AV530_007812 [Patagioenas fasciata monilis]